MPLLTPFPSTALEEHGQSKSSTLFKQLPSNDKSFLLYFFSGRAYKHAASISLTSLCKLLEIKLSPGYSWETSEMTCIYKQ